jgi:hypothetical protein
MRILDYIKHVRILCNRDLLKTSFVQYFARHDQSTVNFKQVVLKKIIIRNYSVVKN